MASKEKETESNFIKMKKGNEEIEVAPTSVPNHQALGWQVVEAPAPAATANPEK